jgi:hypothetical protein
MLYLRSLYYWDGAQSQQSPNDIIHIAGFVDRMLSGVLELDEASQVVALLCHSFQWTIWHYIPFNDFENFLSNEKMYS